MGRDESVPPPLGNTGYKPGDVVLSGIDTLEIAYSIKIRRSFMDRLRSAHSSPYGCLKLGPWILDREQRDRRFSSQNYRFVFGGPELAIEASDSEKYGKFPILRLLLRSKLLLGMGLPQAIEIINEILEKEIMKSTLKPEHISRVDPFADLYWPQGLKDAQIKHFVTKCKKRTVYYSDDKLSEFQIGKSPFLSRIYDKSLELSARSKSDQYPVSLETNIRSHLWRVEFEMRRDYLRGKGISTLEDLSKHKGSLWNHCCEKISLRYPRGKNRSRWPLSRFWKAVLKATQRFGEPQKIIKLAQSSPDNEHLEKCLMGMLASWGANKGITDPLILHARISTNLFLDAAQARTLQDLLLKKCSLNRRDSSEESSPFPLSMSRISSVTGDGIDDIIAGFKIPSPTVTGDGWSMTSFGQDFGRKNG